MVIAFPFGFGGRETPQQSGVGELFVRVLHQTQPGCHVVQMSDTETGKVEGVDEVFRVPTAPLALWYFDAMIAFPYKQFLRLDYDIIVRGDLSHVFNLEYDIAIAKERNDTMNNGVVFVKDKSIFAHAKTQYMERTGMDNWLDIQRAMQMSIDSGLFRVLKLNPNIYNETYTGSAMPDSTLIIHFKGGKKKLMPGFVRENSLG